LGPPQGKKAPNPLGEKPPGEFPFKANLGGKKAGLKKGPPKKPPLKGKEAAPSIQKRGPPKNPPPKKKTPGGGPF